MYRYIFNYLKCLYGRYSCISVVFAVNLVSLKIKIEAV